MLSDHSMRPWTSLGGRSHDETHNRMQLEIDAACDALYAVAHPDVIWICNHCDTPINRSEWMPRRLLAEAADKHYQAGRGTKYEGLSGAVYSLAIWHLAKQGVFEDDFDKGIRLTSPSGNKRTDVTAAPTHGGA